MDASTRERSSREVELGQPGDWIDVQTVKFVEGEASSVWRRDPYQLKNDLYGEMKANEVMMDISESPNYRSSMATSDMESANQKPVYLPLPSLHSDGNAIANDSLAAHSIGEGTTAVARADSASVSAGSKRPRDRSSDSASSVKAGRTGISSLDAALKAEHEPNRFIPLVLENRASSGAGGKKKSKGRASSPTSPSSSGKGETVRCLIDSALFIPGIRIAASSALF